eukprot:Gregarina_sp_Pseudo_9__1940@NODE_2335_length_1035_cov_585_611446_g2150_i0_p1_GENE_NODE_2335_length_1035_cov_585_611446_g2150_i0NODE_2335_length_1035_cov_585_611446_g2150_i0_p1_ORF_typecomplete_len244_score29_02_NODE_2335_length_1035_cov_585_611446_g2150_i0225956
MILGLRLLTWASAALAVSSPNEFVRLESVAPATISTKRPPFYVGCNWGYLMRWTEVMFMVLPSDENTDLEGAVYEWGFSHLVSNATSQDGSYTTKVISEENTQSSTVKIEVTVRLRTGNEYRLAHKIDYDGSCWTATDIWWAPPGEDEDGASWPGVSLVTSHILLQRALFIYGDGCTENIPLTGWQISCHALYAVADPSMPSKCAPSPEYKNPHFQLTSQGQSLQWYLGGEAERIKLLQPLSY